MFFPSDFAPVMIETLRHMYEYVPTALDWWHADRFCDQRFAQLLFEPPDSEQSSFSKLLQSHHIKGSVWLNERDGVLHKPKWRREYKWKMKKKHKQNLLMLAGISLSREPYCASPGVWRQNRHKIREGAL